MARDIPVHGPDASLEDIQKAARRIEAQQKLKEEERDAAIEARIEENIEYKNTDQGQVMLRLTEIEDALERIEANINALVKVFIPPEETDAGS